jgi:hypothetical protein
VDNSSNIQEWDFADSYTGFNGSISTHSFKIGAFSRMATYFPSIIFQDDSYMLQEILYNGTIPGNSGGWSQSAMNVNGLNNSGLADVPLTANGNFGVSVFYNRNDQKLFDLARNQSVGGWTPGKCGPCYRLAKPRPLLNRCLLMTSSSRYIVSAHPLCYFDWSVCCPAIF